MQFSTKAEYGLRAMVVLARKYPEKMSIADISNEEEISVKYLEQIIQELRKNNLVKSLKGKSGGYVLSKDPKEISAADIIEPLEGKFTETKCLSDECRDKNCA
jgi:Rrf2 family protein